MPDPDSADQDEGERATDADRRLAELAYDLHDGLLQYVIAAHMVNEALQRKLAASSFPVPLECGMVQQYLQQALAEGRRLIGQLQTPPGQELDLTASLRRLLQELADEGQVRYEVHIDDDVPLPAAGREALFRIAQEAISNVRRHSHAATVSVRLQRQADAVVLQIADDGRGFDPAAVGPGHLGLISMRQRIESRGGQLRIESAAGQGTRIVVHLPMTTTT